MTVRDYIIIKRGGFLFLCSHATVIVHPRSSNEKNVRLLSSNHNLRLLYQHRLCSWRFTRLCQGTRYDNRFNRTSYCSPRIIAQILMHLMVKQYIHTYIHQL